MIPVVSLEEELSEVIENVNNFLNKYYPAGVPYDYLSAQENISSFTFGLLESKFPVQAMPQVLVGRHPNGDIGVQIGNIIMDETKGWN